MSQFAFLAAEFAEAHAFAARAETAVTGRDFLSEPDAEFDAAIPEPGAWTLMIMGVGLVGAAARRQRAAAALLP